jgi:hypothetical protein
MAGPQPAQFEAFGNVAEESVLPNAVVQFKRFEIVFPIWPQSGHQELPHGWDWHHWTVTLQRIANPGQVPYGNFLADWQAISYGRHSAEHSWTYNLTIFHGENPLRDFELGRGGIGCGVTPGVFQGRIPAQEGQGLPEAYFGLITKVRLRGSGLQSTC